MRKLLLVFLLCISASIVSAEEIYPADALDDAFLLRAAATEGDAISGFIVAQMLEKRIAAIDDASRKRALSAALIRMPEGTEIPTQDLVLLALQLTSGATAHDAALRWQRVQSLEAASADNAYFAVTLLEQTDNADATAVAELIRKGAMGQQYRSMTVPVLRRLYVRFLAATATADSTDETRLISAAGPEAFAFDAALSQTLWVALPGYGKLIGACKNSAAELRVDCARFAVLMREGADNLIDLLIALALQSYTTSDADVLAEVAEHRREAQWLQTQMMLLSAGFDDISDAETWSPCTRARFSRFMQSWLADGELAAIRGIMRDADVSLLPPSDWQPSGVHFQPAAPDSKD